MRVQPFRTISVMVNASCNLSCAHCDLPDQYSKYDPGLDAQEWKRLLEKLIPQIDPEVIAIAAMEPLLPKTGQPKTLSILETANKHQVAAGLVTNGVYASDFFETVHDGLKLDFMDVSVEGTSEIDAVIRGDGHFAAVDDFLKSQVYEPFVERTYISCTLTKRNVHLSVLEKFFGWIKSRLREPRLTLLLLYPNEHVDRELFLEDDDFLRVLDFITKESEDFSDIFLEIFPSSLPGFSRFVAEGVLPDESEVIRDDGGMLWGHVSENLYVRYVSKQDLLHYHLRISPEGFVLTPDNLECADYLNGSLGNLLQDEWELLQKRILDVTMNAQSMLPSYCAGKSCVRLCKGENTRCIFREDFIKDDHDYRGQIAVGL